MPSYDTAHDTAEALPKSSATQTDKQQRMDVNHISSKKFTDVEELLIRNFGSAFEAYRQSYRASLNYDKSGEWPEFPLTVSLELVNRCNLDCIMCYTINHKEKKFMLGVADIDRVLEECKAHNLPAMVVGLGSEVLLYKQIQDVLSRIRSAGVMDVFLGTNGVLLNDEICDFVVDNKIARVEISIDATTRETYQKIRGKDEFERVTSNVRRLIEAKRRKNSDLPIIRLCFCVQELNIDEADEFVETWRDLVDYVDLQEMIDFSYVDELRATGTIKEIENIRNEDIDETYCAYPFNSLHVWANGDITPCCTFFGKSLVVGNIKDTTLTDVWNGDGMQQIRQEILSGNLNPTCKVCLAQRDRERFAAAQKKVSD